MIIVYFECNGCAEKVATFEDHELYARVAPELERLAKDEGFILTETEQ